MRRKAKLTIVIMLFFLVAEIRLHRNLPCGIEFKETRKPVVPGSTLVVILLFILHNNGEGRKKKKKNPDLFFKRKIKGLILHQ